MSLAVTLLFHIASGGRRERLQRPRLNHLKWCASWQLRMPSEWITCNPQRNGTHTLRAGSVALLA